MQVGKTKDQGLYNKASAAVHPGALAAGTLPQYNTIQYKWPIILICSMSLSLIICVKFIKKAKYFGPFTYFHFHAIVYL